MTKPSSLSKRMSENAEPLTEGAQSQTASVLAALIEQHCHLSLGICIYGIFQNLAHGLRAKNGKNLTLKNREKMSLNARRGFLESYILRREAFLLEKMKRQCHRSLDKLIFILSAGLALQKRMKNEKKYFYNRGCKGNL